jgi:hypothetical protein
MNFHIYKHIEPLICNQCTLLNFPQNQKETGKPDYFLVPKIIFVKENDPQLNEFSNKFKEICENLPYWKTHKNKHVFFIGGGSGHQFDFLKDSIVFQHSCSNKSKDLAYPYFTNDEMKTFKYVRTITNCDYACSFMGCINTHPIRKKLESSLQTLKAKTYFEKNEDYFEFLSDQVKAHQQQKYRILINNSMFFLCPKGYGLNSLRFFETLSFGRIPILISDDTKLPIPKTIDYSKIMIRLPENEIHKLPDYIMKFMDENDMKTASKLARQTWMRYFRLSSFPVFLQVALRDNQ